MNATPEKIQNGGGSGIVWALRLPDGSYVMNRQGELKVFNRKRDAVRWLASQPKVSSGA